MTPEEKSSKIKEGGAANLHIIADFDRTLTKPVVGGEKSTSSIGLVRAGGYLGEEYTKTSYALFDYYHAIEIDTSIPLEERSVKMQEWWEKHLQLMIDHGMHKDVVDQIVRKKATVFRDGFHEMAELLHTNQIPMLIFSAGSGDIIEGLLAQDYDLFENIHVVSNFLKFDEEGKATGYKSNIIHVFNKNEVAIKDTPYAKEMKERKNVILLGDVPADLGMAAGVTHDVLLSIGFCNFDFEAKKKEYEKYFDIVLPDTSLQYVIDLLKDIVK